MNQSSPQIIIIDNDIGTTESLRFLFESISLPVKTYHCPRKFLENFNSQDHGCLLIDVRLPYMSGVELLEHLNTQKHYFSIILMTAYGDVPTAVRAMKAGAVDFILKPINDQSLLETVQHCLNKPQENHHDDFRERFNELTQREQQVLNLILEGKLNKEIAYQLSIAISTVEAHRARIMKKMKVRNLAQLMKLCLQLLSNHLGT